MDNKLEIKDLNKDIWALAWSVLHFDEGMEGGGEPTSHTIQAFILTHCASWAQQSHVRTSKDDVVWLSQCSIIASVLLYVKKKKIICVP